MSESFDLPADAPAQAVLVPSNRDDLGLQIVVFRSAESAARYGTEIDRLKEIVPQAGDDSQVKVVKNVVVLVGRPSGDEERGRVLAALATLEG